MDNTQCMRYAIYARYSSDLQRQTSIADQVRKCEEFGRSQGWFPAKGCIYTDEAVSGVSTERPGLQRMLQAVVSTPEAARNAAGVIHQNYVEGLQEDRLHAEPGEGASP